jgi:DNA (cytosine-5)-methyltransferase 1
LPKAYYNEIDPKAAAWLRELIKAGLIADGEVDTRSIVDVRPGDLRGFRQCHFFAGIGGWSYALRLAGWPDDRAVWTGSCPCQPFSAAGKGKGEADERHLWPIFRGLIAECKPSVVFGEQVASKLGRAWLAGVFADLEALAYRRAGADLCAAGVGAFHIRQRLYWVADSAGGGCRQGCKDGSGRSKGARALEEWRGLEQRSEFGELAVSDYERLEGRSVHLLSGEPRSAGSYVIGNGEVGELADSERGTAERYGFPMDGASSEIEGGASERQRVWFDVGDGFAIGELGDSGGSGFQERERNGRIQRGAVGAFEGQTPECGGDSLNPWAACDWIPCRDGKLRPVEPGSFPLAHGVPARVGRLRGYGNAIVPQVAAEFIAAYLDVTEGVLC